MAPKAVPHGGGAGDGRQERLKPLAGNTYRVPLAEDPPVEGPADHGAGEAGEAPEVEAPVPPEGAQLVDPGLERPVVLLQELPGQCGARLGVAP